MIDHKSEELLTFPEAAALLPSRPHLSTLHRWRLRGIRGIRLESVMVGGRRYTSRQALDRFFANTTAVSDATQLDPPQLSDDVTRLEQELERRGI